MSKKLHKIAIFSLFKQFDAKCYRENLSSESILSEWNVKATILH